MAPKVSWWGCYTAEGRRVDLLGAAAVNVFTVQHQSSAGSHGLNSPLFCLACGQTLIYWPTPTVHTGVNGLSSGAGGAQVGKLRG